MLRVRVPIAIALIAGFLAILWLDYGSYWKIGCHFLFLLIVVLGLSEAYHLIETGSAFQPIKSIGIVGVLALILGEWLSYHPAIRGLAVGIWSINGILLGLIIFLLLAYHSSPEKYADALGNIATTLFGLMYVWFLGSYLLKIAMLQNPKFADQDIGIPCLLLTIMTAKFADIGAYLFGRVFGKRKLAPQISPNKSVEGAIGGLLMSVLVCCLIQHFLRIPFLSWFETILFGIIIGCLGQLGDLAESLFKRICTVKDSGTILPGFGGTLDVIDSLLTAGPASYVLLHLFAETIRQGHG